MSVKPFDRAQAVRRVLWLVLLFNLALALTKLVVGLTSGALAVVADAFHSLVDSSGNIVGLLGVWVAARPADENHPYGHHKYETVATLAIGGLLLVAAFEIGRSVVERAFVAPQAPHVTPLVVGLMVLTFFANLGLTIYETRAGRRLKSALLLADAAHTRVDMYVTLSVLGALVGTLLGLAWLDLVVAAGVAVILFRAAFDILRSSSEVLTDVAVANPGAIELAARAVPGVTDVGSVRSRGQADATYVDLNIKVNPAMDADQAHAVASEVEQRIAQALPGVVDTVVHIEPEWAGTPQTAWEDLALTLRGLADGLGLGLHDLHGHVERDGGFTVEVHLEMTEDFTLGEAHAVADVFEARARELLPQLGALVTHLEPLTSLVPEEAGRLTVDGAGRLRLRLMALADSVAGPGACHEVELHDINGHLTATLHVTQPADLPLTEAHVLAERVERLLRANEASLNRIVVHVEAPE